MLAVVVEETCMHHVNTPEWKKYCKNMKRDNEQIWSREFFMPKFLKKIHIVMVSNTMQLVFHKNLHVNLHYSISRQKNLDMITAYCDFSGINVTSYNTDTSYTDFDNVVVLNNFKQSVITQYMKRLQAENVMDILTKKGKKIKGLAQLAGQLLLLDVMHRDGGIQIQNWINLPKQED